MPYLAKNPFSAPITKGRAVRERDDAKADVGHFRGIVGKQPSRHPVGTPDSKLAAAERRRKAAAPVNGPRRGEDFVHGRDGKTGTPVLRRRGRNEIFSPSSGVNGLRTEVPGCSGRSIRPCRCSGSFESSPMEHKKFWDLIHTTVAPKRPVSAGASWETGRRGDPCGPAVGGCRRDAPGRRRACRLRAGRRSGAWVGPRDPAAKLPRSARTFSGWPGAGSLLRAAHHPARREIATRVPGFADAESVQVSGGHVRGHLWRGTTTRWTS